jgi:hypothetical protein
MGKPNNLFVFRLFNSGSDSITCDFEMCTEIYLLFCTIQDSNQEETSILACALHVHRFGRVKLHHWPGIMDNKICRIFKCILHCNA